MAAESKPRHLPVPVARAAVRLMGRLVFREDLPYETQRSRLAGVAKSGTLPPGTTVTERRVGGVDADEVRHVSSSPDLVVVHFHGGGYVTGTPATSRSWAAPLAAATGATVVLPDYRLAPEHPFPAAPDDAYAVWKELTSGVDPSRIVVSGDSAGAGLALSLATRLRDEGSALPAGLVLISPWLDLSANRRSDADLVRRDVMLHPAWLERATDAYVGGADLDDPAISPLQGSVSDLPPILVQAGTDDILVPDAIALARGVREAGGEVTLSLGNGLWHDFPMQAGMLAAADGAIRQTAAFVGRVTAPAD